MATAKIEERLAVVLSRVAQKERDAMIRAYDKDGLFSFYARGALKVGGATGFATQELALSALNLTESSSGAYTLKEGRLRHLYAPSGGLEGLLVAQLILEFALKALPEEDAASFYPTFIKALEALEQGGDPFSVATMFLAKAFKTSGYGLEVTRCVNCGSTKDIVAMSYVHGGFLCRDCLDLAEAMPTDIEELKILRHAFLAPEEDFLRVTYPQKNIQNVLLHLLNHLHDAIGIRLHSLDAVVHFHQE